jgi:oligopeptide/dipeptide ABC transporter ATP-binding protein
VKTAALSVEELRIVSFRDVEIVSGVNLEIEPGKLLGLLGETGAGKTLTARAILGLLPRGLRATGRVRFADSEWMPLSSPSAIAQRLGRTVGLMLQNPVNSFDPLQRIGPQLIESVTRNKLMSKDSAHERAAQLCEQLGLGSADLLFRLYPHEISGGMAQRIALALALMPSPRLIVVDEPTSALDANLRIEALKILQRTSRETGMAMLVVSHDLGLVSHYCDKIAILYAGHLMEMGAMESVLHSPSHPYTATLISCSLGLDRPARAVLPVVGGEPPLPGNWPTGCYFHPRCPDAESRCKSEAPSLTSYRERLVACHFPREEERV